MTVVIERNTLIIKNEAVGRSKYVTLDQTMQGEADETEWCINPSYSILTIISVTSVVQGKKQIDSLTESV